MKRLFWSITPIAALLAAYAYLESTGALQVLYDPLVLQEQVGQLGWVGPVAVILLLAVAIILSPIPSAPIALVAGALYGHTIGTLYVVIGAELGAIAAFWLARVLGYDAVRRRVGDKVWSSVRLSQGTLMGAVFFSRLLPFISFDTVSYAAGLTPLNFWRFALATLGGILPASFVLAHLGSELRTDDVEPFVWTVVGIGLVTASSLAFYVVKRERKRGVESAP